MKIKTKYKKEKNKQFFVNEVIPAQLTIKKDIIKSPDEILDLFNKKEIDKEWSFENFKPSNTSKWTHGYHRYPAKFIPQLVEKIIDEYIPNSNDAHINDPFMGSGTTIVTAISRSFKASGTDINKISYLITKVKSTPIEPNYLNKKIDNFFNKINLIKNDKVLFHKTVKALIPQKHIEKINYWFDNKTKYELGKILNIIHEEKDEKIRNFLLVAFSHILKNCSRWLQGSTKPTRDLTKKILDPYDLIKRHLNKMKNRNKDFYDIVPQKIKDNIDNFLNIKIGDARNQPVQNNCVDLIITSSPYVTSYEYADLHQLSTIWFDFVDDLIEYRKQFIGTSYKKYENKILKSKIGKSIVNEMYEKNIKMAKEIEAFFIDMEEVFSESYRILKNNGRCCYVIGNTKLKGVNILNAEVFAESLQYSGFKLDRIIKREIPSKILPQKRDEKTGRFANSNNGNFEAYPIEYVVIGIKEG